MTDKNKHIDATITNSTDRVIATDALKWQQLGEKLGEPIPLKDALLISAVSYLSFAVERK